MHRPRHIEARDVPHARHSPARRLVRRGEIVRDEWRYAEEDPLGRERALILPFGRWTVERRRWWLWDGRLGVRLAPEDPVAALEHDFLRLSLVALDLAGGVARGVPTHPVGDRAGDSGGAPAGVHAAASSEPAVAELCRRAELLRRRYRYTGELRAIGPVAARWLPRLARAGFDAFELPRDADLASALAQLADRVSAPQPCAAVVPCPA